MNRLVLLQLVLAIWTGLGSAQSLFFPGDVPVETTNRRNNPISMPPVRTFNRPQCSFNAGQDQDAPCEQDEDYDASVMAHVNSIIAQSGLNDIVSNPLFKDLIKTQDTTFRTSSRPGESPTTRFGATETPVCQSEETLIFPKRAKSSNNEWVFVLNHENIEQALRVEKCINEGNPCEFETPLPSEIKTVCRQKYVYRRMITIGSNAIQPEEVLMPSCCVCYRKSGVFDIGSRTRLPGNPDVHNVQPMTPINTPQPANTFLPAADQPMAAHQPANTFLPAADQPMAAHQPAQPVVPNQPVTGRPDHPFLPNQPVGDLNRRLNMFFQPSSHIHRRRGLSVMPAIRGGRVEFNYN